LRLCLLQELVSRGIPVGNVRQVAGHPLARLPSRLLDIESDVLPNHLPGLSSEGLKELTTGTNIVRVTEVASADPISSAVRVWITESNGMYEAKVFQTEGPVGAQDLSPGFLRSLHLDCLGDDIVAQVVSASRAFALLFLAASSGGAYGGNPHRAYGRLAAWESLGGLAGAIDGQTIESIEVLAKQCTWVSLVSDSDWFYQVAWDVALLAIRPDGRSVAVLAATDTD
jgi:hypothetical protein